MPRPINKNQDKEIQCPTNPDIECWYNDSPDGFFHCLFQKSTGKKTFWATYDTATFLDGVVGVTPYYGAYTDDTIRFITPEEYCSLVCNTIEPH